MHSCRATPRGGWPGILPAGSSVERCTALHSPIPHASLASGASVDARVLGRAPTPLAFSYSCIPLSALSTTSALLPACCSIFGAACKLQQSVLNYQAGVPGPSRGSYQLRKLVTDQPPPLDSPTLTTAMPGGQAAFEKWPWRALQQPYPGTRRTSAERTPRHLQHLRRHGHIPPRRLRQSWPSALCQVVCTSCPQCSVLGSRTAVAFVDSRTLALPS